ncbi:MAG: sigma-70 family RNA polymerase sigma factor [Planctomycetota bacterium]
MLRRQLPGELAVDAEAEFWGYLFQSGALARANRSLRFRAYLAGIVLNYARSWLRSRRRGQASPELFEQVCASAATDPPQEDIWLWARQTVVLALDAMTTKFPIQVDVLRWFYGLPTGDREEPALPVPEIASKLGKSHAAIQQDLSRGRVRLRQHIEDELREQVGSAADWQDELRVVLGVIDQKQPGLLPPR